MNTVNGRLGDFGKRRIMAAMSKNDIATKVRAGDGEWASRRNGELAVIVVPGCESARGLAQSKTLSRYSGPAVARTLRRRGACCPKDATAGGRCNRNAIWSLGRLGTPPIPLIHAYSRLAVESFFGRAMSMGVAAATPYRVGSFLVFLGFFGTPLGRGLAAQLPEGRLRRIFFAQKSP